MSPKNAMEEKRKFVYKVKSKFVGDGDISTKVKVPITASELIVITKSKDLCNYIFLITKNSAKKFRSTFISKLQNFALCVIENLFRANLCDIKEQKEERKKFQDNAMTELKLLEYFALLSFENECILKKHYEQIAKQGSEILILLVNWIKSDKKRNDVSTD